MQKNQQMTTGFNWRIYILPLLALVLIGLTIAGTSPERQFTLGLLTGLGVGLILAIVYAFFAQRR